MAGYQASKQYPVSVASSDVPASMLPVSAPRPVANNVRQVVIQCNSGNAISAGSRMEFTIPASAGYIKSGSVFLRGSVSVAGGSTWNFGLPTDSASALINRATLQIGGTQVERVDNYHLCESIATLHATSSGYWSADQLVQDRPKGNTATNTADASFNHPLKLQLLQNGFHLPLWCVAPGSMTIALDTNVLSEAIYDSTATASTGYTINSPQLVMDIIECPPEFIAGMKAQMAQGKAYSIPFLAVRSSVVADQQTQTVNLALNASSLRGVAWFARNKAQNNRGLFASGTQSYARLYVDGALANSCDGQDAPTQFSLLNNFLGKINDYTITSTPALTAANYITDYFVGAISTKVCDDAGFAFCGKPCSALSLQVSKANASGQLYVFSFYDCLLSIGPDMVPAVIQ